MKNNYFIYNLKAILRSLYPSLLLPKNREKLLKSLDKRNDLEYIKNRVNYYCRLNDFKTLGEDSKELSFLRFTIKKTVYFFDTYEYAMYFPKDFKAYFAFGDINYFLDKPSITKSRPITNGGGYNKNQNSILLNLDKIRHFTFINDRFNFDDKKALLFYRGGIYQSHRIKFFEKYFNNKICDIGHTGSKSINKQWLKPKISIAKHLPYKFLLSLEGNDVASNLKWVMSSNSLCIMPKPKFETWFMEGTLVPNYHYAEINDDYSNLEEVLCYYRQNPTKAKNIIQNAQEYTKQFFDKQREDIISILVLEKYFYYTKQLYKIRI
ncbi:glycosyl transferase family 90 [Helicobacter sp. MIT 14-3879]|uniref:glycosyl transferase family 90 n=1 Tax=Helicobacter sp. MIT 14-3879 TaxID=2040649 RepID=UPI000E1E52B2|nr:glycosyl transferase family 90 [Helicobacter sp. MIT 14-3879]RDU62447.1 lipopolysaccharide core biosynthesis protein LpsA [Helicobacter sp. MIT 14-3879]